MTWSFQKCRTGYDLSCIIWKDGVFFQEYMIFFLDRKWKMIFLKKCMEIWYFLYICINVTNTIIPFCKKIEDNLLPKKIHLKVNDILDCILERILKILCTFVETFIDVFIAFIVYCFPVKKTRETWYIELKFDFFFNLFGGRRYSTTKTLQYSVSFNPHELYLEVCFSAN